MCECGMERTDLGSAQAQDGELAVLGLTALPEMECLMPGGYDGGEALVACCSIQFSDVNRHIVDPPALATFEGVGDYGWL